LSSDEHRHTAGAGARRDAAGARSAQPEERALANDGNPQPPLHVVLVRPQIPPNTGNVARLCAATGCALHLVEPLGFSIGDRELKRAGLDYWRAVDLRVHASLEAFLAACEAPLWLLSTRGTRRYDAAPFARGDAVVFGPETAGLPQSLLDAHPERVLRVPMREDAVRSLNLATTVGIVTYAALARIGFPGLH
jgi:tRNA (cytidine/uridine-2'-O-)-methyltransferase